jgi:hypothetical protein
VTDGTLRFLRDLLDGVRRAETTYPGTVMRPAVSNRHAREMLDEIDRLRDLFGDHGLDPDRCGKYPGGEQCALRHGHAGRCEWAGGD